MRGRTFFTRVSLLLLGGCTAITGASSLEISSEEASVTTGDDAAAPSSTTTNGDASAPGTPDGGQTDSSTGDVSIDASPDGEGGSSGPITETFEDSLSAPNDRSYGPFAVQPGTSVEVKTTGSGDVDLYINFGSPATDSEYACGSSLSNAIESCKKTAPSGNSDLWVLLTAFTDTNYKLTITYQPKP